jgi:hypothetical protein
VTLVGWQFAFPGAIADLAILAVASAWRTHDETLSQGARVAGRDAGAMA